ncbi:MAG: MliC family protein [Dyella sp.]|uniref:MliC family protein n=1 Tax=Dyella sp. AD56 TaxID=1528744 RepID=UPI0021011F73|nr:MliC family protein [Dyella sp. AD56]MDR3447076.1 MliC family protein [Dyella sp.]
MTSATAANRSRSPTTTARGGQSFAMLTVKGNAMLFVDTLAASGVRYVAGPYVWWTKGNNGDLYDMTAGPNAAPIIGGCTSASH